MSRQPWHTKELKQRQLTSNTAENPVAYGALSPDGRTLAVLDEGGLSLRSIDSGESSALRIPEGFTLAGYPFVLISWFPDGSRLLLSGRSSDGKPYVWALPVLGGRARKLIVGGEFATISRDGKHLAFVRAGKEGNDLWCSGAQGEDPRPIVSSDSSGSISLWGVWSPNGHRLMYERITANARGFNAYLESCDLGGHRRVAFAADGGQNLHSATVPLWLPDGRLLFGLSDPPPSQAELNLWSLHVDPASGAPSGKPRRITQWQRVSLVAATGVSTDGRRLSLGLLSYQSDCFIGEIAPGSTILSSPRRLTMDDRFDLQPSWTSDGKAILFASDRNGTMDIFRQALDATEAEPLVSGEGDQMAPCTSPDGAWILYKDGGAGPVIRGGGSARIMRIPSSGGPPEKVLDTQAIAAFRCAKHAGTPCVLGELTGDHMVFTGFDPVRGRGPQLARVRVDGPEPWDLSPDGTKLAVMDKQDSLPRIRVVPLHGGPAHEVRLDRRIGITNVAWAADGSRWMVVGNLQKSEKGGWRMLRVEPGGRTSEMLPPQMWMYSAAASADGRHVVYTSNTIDSNIWLLENF